MIDPIVLEFNRPLELIPNLMVYRTYDPGTKIATIRMVIQRHPWDFIRRMLGASISRQTFNRWITLYEETQRVIRNPETYERQGRPSRLTEEDRQFMRDLVEHEPGLFLDEIRERVFDSNETLLGMTTIHTNLVNRLNVTLKKADMVNICKSLVKKFAWIERMLNIPAEYLVFTDKSGICSRDLLQTFSRSRRGQPSVRYQIE